MLGSQFQESKEHHNPTLTDLGTPRSSVVYIQHVLGVKSEITDYLSKLKEIIKADTID